MAAVAREPFHAAFQGAFHNGEGRQTDVASVKLTQPTEEGSGNEEQQQQRIKGARDGGRTTRGDKGARY